MSVLEKPVHIALLKPTHLETLQKEGKLQEQRFAVGYSPRAPLPTGQSTKKFDVPVSQVIKQVKAQTEVKNTWSRTPPIPADKQPNCSKCSSSACCRVFIVNITKQEYESGFYGDNAVLLTVEAQQQLDFATRVLNGIPDKQENQYMLEGAVGYPCPFLKNNRCSIYEIRPTTCRTYTCVDDPRITEELKTAKDLQPEDVVFMRLKNARERT